MGGFGLLYGFGVCYCVSCLRFCFEFSFGLNGGGYVVEIGSCYV